MITAYYLLTITVCMLVIGCCICRVNSMRWSTNHPAWLVVYIGWAYYAGGIGVDTATQHRADSGDWAVLLNLLLHFFLTWDRWRAGPPEETTRPSPLDFCVPKEK